MATRIDKRYCGAKEMAERLSIQRTHVYVLIARGRLDAEKKEGRQVIDLKGERTQVYLKDRQARLDAREIKFEKTNKQVLGEGATDDKTLGLKADGKYIGIDEVLRRKALADLRIKNLKIEELRGELISRRLVEGLYNGMITALEDLQNIPQRYTRELAASLGVSAPRKISTSQEKMTKITDEIINNIRTRAHDFMTQIPELKENA